MATLADKLQIRPDWYISIQHAPDSFNLGETPEGVTITTDTGGQYDFVLLFVRNKAEIDQHAPSAMSAVKSGGALWFAYPKKTSGLSTDIHRDAGWDTVQAAGYAGVRQIAIDATWSALRFRPESEIKRRQR